MISLLDITSIYCENIFCIGCSLSVEVVKALIVLIYIFIVFSFIFGTHTIILILSFLVVFIFENKFIVLLVENFSSIIACLLFWF